MCRESCVHRILATLLSAGFVAVTLTPRKNSARLLATDHQIKLTRLLETDRVLVGAYSAQYECKTYMGIPTQVLHANIPYMLHGAGTTRLRRQRRRYPHLCRISCSNSAAARRQTEAGDRQRQRQRQGQRQRQRRRRRRRQSLIQRSVTDCSCVGVGNTRWLLHTTLSIAIDNQNRAVQL